MLVGQQGNGELAAGVLQAWQRDFALERPFVAMTLDADAHSARKDQLTSQICVANRRTAFGGNADDAFTDDHFRADSRDWKSMTGDGKEPLFFFVGYQQET